jgi:hypothetical protein
MLLRALLLVFAIGCTTTTSQTSSSETASADRPSGPKKKEKCREELITGSRIRKKICEGDIDADNVAEVDKQTWGNEQKRVARPREGN